MNGLSSIDLATQDRLSWPKDSWVLTPSMKPTEILRSFYWYPILTKKTRVMSVYSFMIQISGKSTVIKNEANYL